MTDQTGRPDDETRPDGTTPQPEQPQGRDEATPESVLTGFSWDDPSGAAPRRPEDDPQGAARDGDQPSTGDGSSASPSSGSSAADPARSYDAPPAYDAPPSYGSVPDAPAQYPPAAPYPPAGDPYGQGSAGQQQGEPYGQPSPYGQAPAPYPTQSGGYGQSAEYTSTPQPYAYGPSPLSPEAEKARSGAILWTILNGVAIFLCGNLLAIGGVICAAIAIGKAREDVQASRSLTRWSWILFATGFAIGLILLIAFVALGFAGALGTASSVNEF